MNHSAVGKAVSLFQPDTWNTAVYPSFQFCSKLRRIEMLHDLARQNRTELMQHCSTTRLTKPAQVTNLPLTETNGSATRPIPLKSWWPSLAQSSCSATLACRSLPVPTRPATPPAGSRCSRVTTEQSSPLSALRQRLRNFYAVPKGIKGGRQPTAYLGACLLRTEKTSSIPDLRSDKARHALPLRVVARIG